ncbi:MAG: M1 family metallopeptidase [Candidatus Marinimicrobia bacterium]|nr:M1 family metallopeptidase [Candidatus Neomarinimicrobiota bacterium]
MYKKSILFCKSIFIVVGISLFFLYAGDNDYWQQWVHYQMNVSLDPEEHLLSGESSITYVNNSPDTLDRIYMHLYPNAFQEGSVKHREYKTVHYSGGISEDNPSYIKVKDFYVGKNDVKDSLEFKVDDTILSADLLSPLLPGDTLFFHLNWEHKVREHEGRAGYKGDQYDFAQWYPKLVVYDEKGWHNVPFHAMGEFYGEFGTFDVTIDIPEHFIVGATGVVVEGDPGWEAVTVDTSLDFSEWIDGLDSTIVDSAVRRIVSFHAENVHDFAWITSPTFVYEHGMWNDIDIHVLYNKSVGEKWTKVVRERSERAVEWLSTQFGPYPYPQVTTTHALLGGGMEYPMLVMNGRESEGLIVHEIGHIWFFGILGNNEVDDAWLDEGFTTFQTGWYMNNRYPPYGIDFENSTRYGDFEKKWWKFTTRFESTQWQVNQYITSKYNEPIAKTSSSFGGYGSYRMNAYSKPALMLYSLRYLLGDEVFDRAMKTYYQRWMLKHPDEDRFRSVMEEVSGQELDWFFDQWLHSSSYVDYALKGWEKKRNDDGGFEVTLKIVNKSNIFSPLDIDVYLTNGDTSRVRWTNHLYRWKDEFTFTVPGEPKKIVLDPDNWTHDVDLRNNTSGIFPHKFVFNLPGMNYQPRGAYVVKWNPIIWYHEKDGIKPGISLSRNYGSLSKLSVSVTMGSESEKVFGEAYYSSTFQSLSPFLKGSTWYYSLEGVEGTGVNLNYRWYQSYNFPPNHDLNVGFYLTNADDSGYTDLYEPGKVVVFYGKYGISANMEGKGGGLDLELSTSPGGFSDWSFTRLIGEVKLNMPLKGIDMALRVIGGHIESDILGVPVQEKFTIQSAGSGDYFSKPYLRHETSFYNVKVGDKYFRNQIHLYGDANMRGYYNHGLEGAESVFTTTVEGTKKLPVGFAKVAFRTFIDGGFIWSDADDLERKWLLDLGFGLSFQKKIFGADIKLRLDFPWYLSYTPGSMSRLDFSRFVIGFDTGLF